MLINRQIVDGPLLDGWHNSNEIIPKGKKGQILEIVYGDGVTYTYNFDPKTGLWGDNFYGNKFYRFTLIEINETVTKNMSLCKEKVEDFKKRGEKARWRIIENEKEKL